MSSNSIMLDLETICSGPNAAILSIGACKFDPNSNIVDSAFYIRISTQEQCELFGRTKSADTMQWWSEQSDHARRVFDEKTEHVDIALDKFSQYCGDDAQVWGNGVGFDNVILRNLYIAAKYPVPWKFYNDRDFRTMKNLLLPREFVKPEFVGTPHYAVDDAIHQAKVLQAILKALNLKI